jgi:uncharacterized protein with HEPN domain
MPGDDLLYLAQMLDTARKGAAKTKGISRAMYNGDENLRLALAHLVQIIGEAARRVSPETCTAYPEIPWREIVGMRHKIVHDYMTLDEDVLWQVVTSDLPPLVAALEKVVSLDSPGSIMS